jgi:hypothetical protein
MLQQIFGNFRSRFALTIFFVALSTEVLFGQSGDERLRILLVASDGVIPSIETITATAPADGYTVSVRLLKNVRQPQSWPAAVVALAVFAQPGKQAQEAFDLLNEFQSTKSPFGCQENCPQHKRPQPVTEWETRARSTVPLALAQLLKKEPMVSGNARRGQSISTANEPLEALTKLALGEDEVLDLPWLSRDEQEARVQRLELQLDAVRALQLSGRADAQARLGQVSKESTSALVRTQAQAALDSFGSPLGKHFR